MTDNQRKLQDDCDEVAKVIEDLVSGKYLWCPECEGYDVLAKDAPEKCPDCGGELVVKKISVWFDGLCGLRTQVMVDVYSGEFDYGRIYVHAPRDYKESTIWVDTGTMAVMGRRDRDTALSYLSGEACMLLQDSFKTLYEYELKTGMHWKT